MQPHPTLYLHRAVFEGFGLYNTSFAIAADYDTLPRYLAKGQINLAYIPEVLAKLRLGGESNSSLGRIIRKSQEDLRAIHINKVGGVGILLAKNVCKLGQFIVKDRKAK